MKILDNTPMVVNRQGEAWSPEGKLGDVTSKEFWNALGASQSISTLTSILPTIIQQKYYTLALAKFVDIEIGTGNPFASDLFNWTTGIKGGSFEAGLLNMSSNESSNVGDDIFVEPIKRPVIGWAKDVSWNVLNEGTFAAGTQVMDLIQAKFSARKKEYDLGIQKTAFFGLEGHTDFTGMLTLPNVSSNVALITKYLKDMTSTEYNAVVAGLMSDYMSSTEYTAIPNTFLIPAIDYYGLGSQMSATYPTKTKLEVLRDMFIELTSNADFNVMPLAYSDKARNASIAGLNLNRYVLYNKDPETLIMNIPLDFTVTLPNSQNNFDYNSKAYSRFTGVTAFRPKEIRYYDF